MTFFIFLTSLTLLFYLFSIILRIKNKIKSDNKTCCILLCIMLFYVTLFRAINLVSFYDEIISCYGPYQFINFWLMSWGLFITSIYNFLIVYIKK